MKGPESLERREFTLAAVMAVLAGATIVIEEGCGGGSSSPSSPTSPGGGTGGTPSPAAGDVTGSISSNHGHQAVVTAAQLTAGNQVSLDIRGTADHTHNVLLSADDITTIRQGGQVARESTNTTSHTHMVTFLGSSNSGGGQY
jgi:hypothetical protein